MPKAITTWSLTILACLIIPTAAAAQLKTGTWTGTVTPPDAASVDGTFDVRQSGDSISITLTVQFGDFPFSNIEVSSDRLTFTFTPGTPVNCVLMLQDNGSYSGNCTDAEGAAGVMVMVPPAGTADPALWPPAAGNLAGAETRHDTA